MSFYDAIQYSDRRRPFAPVLTNEERLLERPTSLPITNQLRNRISSFFRLPQVSVQPQVRPRVQRRLQPRKQQRNTEAQNPMSGLFHGFKSFRLIERMKHAIHIFV